MIISNSITEIINEFLELDAGDKQFYDIRSTEVWQELVELELTDSVEICQLEQIIDTLAENYNELCNQFGDKF